MIGLDHPAPIEPRGEAGLILETIIVSRYLEQLRRHASQRPRFGYRRLHVNHKRIYPLHRAEGLAVRRKKRKRPAAGLRVVNQLGVDSFAGLQLQGIS
jgi:transposase InsO family protein